MNTSPSEDTERWSPATPFVDSAAGTSPVRATAARSMTLSPFTAESPFPAEYEAQSDDEAPADTAGEMVEEFLAELHDEEFAAGLESLIGELYEHQPQLFETEASSVAEPAILQYLAPLERAAEELIHAAGEAVSKVESPVPTETELASALEAIDSLAVRGETPAFEQILGGLKKKLKKFAKTAVRAIQTGAAFASGGVLLKFLFARLKPLIRPILEKVAKFALDKVPQHYRPIVGQLARRLGIPLSSGAEPSPAAETGIPASFGANDSGPAIRSESFHEVDAANTPSEPAAPGTASVQAEFDLQLAELLFAGDRMEHEVLGGGQTAAPIATRDPLGELDQARERFVRRIGELDDAEAVGPVVEQFVPAVLFAVRHGIKLLGRPKVVRFLGDLIAKFIAPLVGKENSPGLGRVLSDVGLKAVLQAEVTEQEAQEAAGNTLAAAVEETVRRVSTLADEVLDSPQLFEALAFESFQDAVAANFPTAVVKSELREAAEAPGAWVFLPRRGRKLYKKYSRIFDVRIPFSVAQRIRTFRGTSLGAVLREQMRLDPTAAVSARLHLYEAIPHTRLSRIAVQETVRGLGSSAESAWSQLHPLTPDAAGLLLGAPRLGRELLEETESDTPNIGQRLYFLEMPNAPARTLGRASHLHVSIHVPKNEIRVCLHLSEVLAQRVATSLRRKQAPTGVLAELRASLAAPLAAVDSPIPQGVRLITRRQSAPAGPLATTLARDARRSLKRIVARTALRWTWAQLAQSMESLSATWIAKTEGPEDGVRLCAVFHSAAAMSAIHRALRGMRVSRSEWPPAVMPTGNIEIHAGPRHGE